LGVFVTNATNKLHKIFETNFYPTPVGITSGIYGEPRMIGAEIRYRFGK
jgi:iron complex outermembrane recepter protein